MMAFDLLLIVEAHRFCTGANVHRVKTLIFCYEEAVCQFNEGRPYKTRFEDELRDFVNGARDGRHSS